MRVPRLSASFQDRKCHDVHAKLGTILRPIINHPFFNKEETESVGLKIQQIIGRDDIRNLSGFSLNEINRNVKNALIRLSPVLLSKKHNR